MIDNLPPQYNQPNLTNFILLFFSLSALSIKIQSKLDYGGLLY